MFSLITPNVYGPYKLQPQPRSFETLQAERSYLLSSLQQENIKATDLLRKLRPFEEALVRSDISQIRRRARKQILWLRYRINETTRQEVTILNRLHQLEQEMQGRESWIQIEHEHEHGQHGQNLSGPTSPSDSMQQLPFTPITQQRLLHEYPIQTPLHKEYDARGFPWQQSIWDYTSEMPSEIFSPLSPQGYQRLAENLTFSTQTGDFAAAALTAPTGGERSPSLNILDVEWLKTNTQSVNIQRNKRHSTGSRGASKLWSDKKESNIEGKDGGLDGSQ